MNEFITTFIHVFTKTRTHTHTVIKNIKNNVDFRNMMQMRAEKKISRAIQLGKLLYHIILYR